jgi:serine/threonine protein kinase
VDQRLDTTVALKETLFADERLRKQFEREARLLARLHHQALPRVSDHFSEGDGQFLVMQYIPGDDLSEMTARKGGPYPPDQVLTWGDQLLDALDYLHTQDPQIVHRDIKPQNLKLTPRGQIILLDFGLAKGQAGEVSRVTAAASIFGYTPNYAPLEQVQGLGTDSRSDLYALAATLYHLMTGVKPPDALTRAAALVNGQPDPLQPARQVNPAVAQEVDVVLQKAMAQNREQRFATAAEMRKALQGTNQAVTVANRSEAQTVLFPPSGPTTASPTQAAGRQQTVAAGETTVVRRGEVGSKRRLLPWALSVAALILAAAGLLGYYALQERNKAPIQVTTMATPTPTPVPTESPAVSSPSMMAAENTNSGPANESKRQSNATAPRKDEKTPRAEEAKTAPTPAQVAPPPPPRTSDDQLQEDMKKLEEEIKKKQEQIRQQAQPDNSRGEGQRPPRRNQARTQVLPGGVVIRTFADGSQMITTPDGARVYVGADGKRQVLSPGNKNPRRKVPPPP